MHVKVDCFLCGKVVLYILVLLYPSCSNLDDVWVWKLHWNRPSIIYNSVPLLLLHSHIRYYRQDYFGSSHFPWKNPASRRNKPSLSAPSLDKKGSMDKSLLSATQSWSRSGPGLHVYLRVVDLTYILPFQTCIKQGQQAMWVPPPLPSKFPIVGSAQMFSVCSSNASISYLWQKANSLPNGNAALMETPQLVKKGMWLL